MTEFMHALEAYPFLRLAVVAGLLASVSCGVVGTFVVTRRMTAVAGSLAHAVLGGIGAAHYLRVVHGWSWLHPLHGAMFAALLAAVIVGWVRDRGREREDTVISALWAVGMATGVLFLFRTPGYQADLMTYLFGNIVVVDPGELRLLVGVDVIVLGVVAAFWNPLLAVSYDEEFARLRGVNVPAVTTLLLALTGLAIVTLVAIVGVVMVIALVTLPAAAAGRFTRRLVHTMILAVLLTALLTTGGLALSFRADLPTGATTIMLTAAVYALAHLVSALRDRARNRHP